MGLGAEEQPEAGPLSSLCYQMRASRYRAGDGERQNKGAPGCEREALPGSTSC